MSGGITATPAPPRWLIILLLTAVPGCGSGGNRAITHLALPSLSPADESSWTGARKGEPSIVEVNGIPIPAGRLQRALRDASNDIDAHLILKGVVTEEVLAQAASGENSNVSRSLHLTFERALVARMLEDRLHERFELEDTTREELERAFRIPAVSGRYNHLEIYSVQDFQWICCNANPEHCATPASLACFKEGQAAMDATIQILLELEPESEDLPLLLQDLQQSAARLSFQEYDFAFDPKDGLQKGRQLFDDAVVNAAIAIEPGDFATPVRSDFGWHIIHLKAKLPEIHKDLSDPEVAIEIAEFFHTKFQQRRFFDSLAELLPVQSFQFLAQVYGTWRPEHPPEYPVELYPHALLDMEQPPTDIDKM